MKYIFITFLCMLPFVANGADTMCVKPTTTVVVLDPSIDGTELSSNVTGKTWSTQFSYGVISGIGGCTEDAGGCNKVGCASTQQENITVYSTGSRCFCKMLRPIESKWIYRSYPGANNCPGKCASLCATAAGNEPLLRTGFITNII